MTQSFRGNRHIYHGREGMVQEPHTMLGKPGSLCNPSVQVGGRDSKARLAELACFGFEPQTLAEHTKQ